MPLKKRIHGSTEQAAPSIQKARFDDANAHVQYVKSYAVNNHDSYTLARATELQARVWHLQQRFEEAKTEALRAIDAFEKFGVVKDAERGRNLLQQVDGETRLEQMGRPTNPMTVMSFSQQCWLLTCLLIHWVTVRAMTSTLPLSPSLPQVGVRRLALLPRLSSGSLIRPRISYLPPTLYVCFGYSHTNYPPLPVS